MSYRNKLSFAAAGLLATISFGGVAVAAEDEQAGEASTEVQQQEGTASAEVKDDADEGTWWSPKKKPPARFGVAVNPIGLLLGLIIAEFDYGLSDRLSLNVNGTYWNLDVLGYETTAWGLGLGAQYFPIEVANGGPLYQGFYVYPSLQVASVTVDEVILGEASWVSVAPQAVVGWQWDWRPLTVRVGVGAAYYIGSVAEGYRTDLDGFRVVLDGTLGLTFGG
jgi:hypothetical protein